MKIYAAMMTECWAADLYFGYFKNESDAYDLLEKEKELFLYDNGYDHIPEAYEFIVKEIEVE
jgi:hypothetical protein